MEDKEKDLNAGIAWVRKLESTIVLDRLRCSQCVEAPTHNNGELFPPISSHLYKTFNYTPPHKSQLVSA